MRQGRPATQTPSGNNHGCIPHKNNAHLLENRTTSALYLAIQTEDSRVVHCHPSRRQLYGYAHIYVLFPFGNAMHERHAGKTPRVSFFSSVLVCKWYGKSILSWELAARKRKSTGKQTFPREPFGWEREVRINTETSSVRTGNKYFFRN